MEWNNKIIAEFMGVDQVDIDYAINEHGQLKYHLSWDWLMPVIDKCYQEHMSKHIADAVMTCDIGKAYRVIAEFIKENNDGLKK